MGDVHFLFPTPSLEQEFIVSVYPWADGGVARSREPAGAAQLSASVSTAERGSRTGGFWEL